MIDELKKSGLFEVIGPEKKALEEWKLKTEVKQAEKKKALDIAKKMKKKGYDTDTIKELTGLSVSAIGKL